MSAATTPAPARLAFLDGLRGVAALYVALHHAALMVPPAGLGGAATTVRFMMRHGHYAVPVFIALSGYGLMRRAALAPWEGYAAFLGRRARRILPAYYAALALCWALTATVPALRRPSGTPWDRALPALEPGVAAAHLLMLHNLRGAWFYRVAPPFWTLATEWQCYLIFPALLAACRRYGPSAAVAAGFGVGAALSLLSGALGNPALRALCPWYAGLFALGMAGAARHCGPAGQSGVAWAGGVATALSAPAFAWAGDGALMLSDTAVGAATVGLVIRLEDAAGARRRTPLRTLLESPGAVALGACSYSLYLTHYPLLTLANLTLRGAGLGAGPRLGALLAAVVTACVPIAWLFARAFEGGWVARLRRVQPRPSGRSTGVGAEAAAAGVAFGPYTARAKREFVQGVGNARRTR